jgi:hypothetical protein
MAVRLEVKPEIPFAGPHAIGDLWLVTGLLTFTGRYITGGEVMTGMPAIPGLGRVVTAIITDSEGFTLEFQYATSRVRVLRALGTEIEEATYPSGMREDVNISATFILV